MGRSLLFPAKRAAARWYTEADMQGGTQEMSWSVMTHQHRERSTDWYWGLGVLALAGAAAAIFFGNVLFAIIIVMGASSIGFLAARGPREHAIKMDDRGLSVDGTRYPWTAVHSFWVEHDEETPYLFITMRGAFSPRIMVELDSRQQGDDVREHLRQRVAQEEQGPHIGERLANIFGL